MHICNFAGLQDLQFSFETSAVSFHICFKGSGNHFYNTTHGSVCAIPLSLIRNLLVQDLGKRHLRHSNALCCIRKRPRHAFRITNTSALGAAETWPEGHECHDCIPLRASPASLELAASSYLWRKRVCVTLAPLFQ